MILFLFVDQTMVMADTMGVHSHSQEIEAVEDSPEPQRRCPERKSESGRPIPFPPLIALPVAKPASSSVVIKREELPPAVKQEDVWVNMQGFEADRARSAEIEKALKLEDAARMRRLFQAMFDER